MAEKLIHVLVINSTCPKISMEVCDGSESELMTWAILHCPLDHSFC